MQPEPLAQLATADVSMAEPVVVERAAGLLRLGVVDDAPLRSDIVAEMRLPYEALFPFWAAIAGIVPVLSLALVLEARHLALRWRQQNRKQLRRRRRSRWLISCAYALSLVLLPFLLFDALGGLLGFEPSAFGVVLAGLWVVYTAVLVAWIPAGEILKAGTSDLVNLCAGYLYARRADRLRQAELATRKQHIRDIHRDYASALIKHADALMLNVPRAIALDRDPTLFRRAERQEIFRVSEDLARERAAFVGVRPRILQLDEELAEFQTLPTLREMFDRVDLRETRRELDKVTATLRSASV